MAPMTKRGKVRNYFKGLTIKPNNFALEVKVILDLKSTFTVTNRVKWSKEGFMAPWLIGLRSRNNFGIQL